MKRTRSQVFTDEDGEVSSADQEQTLGSIEVDDQATSNWLEKERVIWDAFREEHYEGAGPASDLHSQSQQRLLRSISSRAVASDHTQAVFTAARVGPTSTWCVVVIPVLTTLPDPFARIHCRPIIYSANIYLSTSGYRIKARYH